MEKFFHSIIKILCDAGGIHLLRTKMSYNRFLNLGKPIQVYLVNKLRKVLASKAFFKIDCNCNSNTKLNIICAYKGEYRKCCIVSKVTCECAALWVAYINTLISTSTIVAYYGKTLFLPPERSPHAITFDMF